MTAGVSFVTEREQKEFFSEHDRAHPLAPLSGSPPAPGVLAVTPTPSTFMTATTGGTTQATCEPVIIIVHALNYLIAYINMPSPSYPLWPALLT